MGETCGFAPQAKDLLERALVQNPLLMQPWVNLGNIEKQLRDDVLEEARGEFTQARPPALPSLCGVAAATGSQSRGG